MLELGNKVKGEVVYKEVFKKLGFDHTSIDMNAKNGAIPLDLRKPLNLGTFDMVTNFGTTEHVSPGNIAGQTACWKNICEAMHVGSVLVSATPAPGAPRWMTHGCWYPEKLFFRGLASHNCMTLERCYTDGVLIFARLRRVEDTPFVMPDEGMYENKNWRQSTDNIC